MNINFLTRGDCVRGAACVESDNAGFQFFRANPALLDFYSYSDAAKCRILCPSGTRIQFRTNSPWMAFSARYGARCREHFYFDVTLNGERHASLGPDQYQERFATRLELGKKNVEKEVVIYLPHMAGVREFILTLADNAALTACPKPAKTWLAIGDSITQGMTTPYPSTTYPARVARALNIEYHNIAVGGAVMDARLVPGALALHWDIASIAFGVNDFAQNIALAAVVDNARKIIEAFSAAGRPRIVLITPTAWMERTDPNALGLSLNDYRAALADVAGEYPRVELVRGETLIPDDRAYFVDDVHPNNLGFESLAKNLAPHIARSLAAV